ncbi:MAG: ABC1 kinase family protein [Sandaracinaceae bacterium]
MALLDTVRDLGRLRQIVQVLIRHGFGEVVQRIGLGSLGSGRAEEEQDGGSRRLAVRIRAVLTELGPSFVKLGQILSTRSDLIPADIIEELRTLQDRVRPIPLEEVARQVQAELGGTLEELFLAFEPDPLASASIGQVHRATLEVDGAPQAVAVKVQRPNLVDTIDRDIDLLYWLARVLERSVPESEVYQPTRLVREFDRAIRAELDYTLEADHAARFSKNFEGHGAIRFPFVYRQASSRRVLTLELFDGHKIYDAIERGYSAEAICKTTLSLILKAVFEDGFFHADPHPGNFILMGSKDAPVVGVIDLGLVGRLTPPLRDKTIDLMIAAVREDYRAIADALYAIGTPRHKFDRAAYEAEVATLAERYLGRRLKDLQVSRLIQDLVQGATRYGLEIPPDFLLVGRAMMTIEGVGREIYPELDVFEEMKPYFLRLMWTRYSPEKVTQDLVRTMGRLSGAATDLPLQSHEILEDLRRGRLEVRTREPMLEVTTELLGRRIQSGLVVSSLLLGGAILASGGAVGLGALFVASAVGAVTVHLWRARRLRRRGRR